MVKKRGKFLTILYYTQSRRKKKNSNNLTFHLKVQEKNKQNSNSAEKKEIIKARAGINKTKAKK